MLLLLDGHDYRFEMENLCRLFVPREKIVVRVADDAFPVSGSPEEAGITAVTRLRREGETACIRCELFLEDFREAAEDRVTPAPGQTEDRCELRMAQLLYSLFVRLFGYAHDWGIVTGVRPIKLLRRLTQERGAEAADAWFRDQLLVLDTIEELAKSGLTCIFNTHFPAHALRRANQALLLGRGGKSVCGKTCDVVTEDRISEFFGVRAVIGEMQTPLGVYQDVIPVSIGREG